jgi:hypothetical protein
MEQLQIQEAAKELAELGARYWAGEAEIVSAFFCKPRSKEEHIHWLRLQCYKEMYGSGLVANPEGIIYGLVERLRKSFPLLESQVGRHDFRHVAEVLYQEISHYCLFADILEELTERKVRLQELATYQFSEDRKLQEVRGHCRRTEGELGELAIAFTEGGRSAIFYAGMKLKGDPILEKVAKACSQVFQDELEHQEYGAEGVERVAKSREDWEKVRRMVEAICQQRLRMRNEMFGFPVSEKRLQEIALGKIEPLHI